MKKKIAFVLIMIMVGNWVVWADSSSDEEGLNPVVTVCLILIVAACLVGGVVAALSEADAPDDGVRLASFQDTQTLTETSSSPVLNLLQRVEIGQTKKDQMYVGLRFKF